MTHIHQVVQPSHTPGTVLSESGELLIPPADWHFLPAGDTAITRSVKARGATWIVQVKKGRRLIAKGIWAPAAHILASQQEVDAKRSTPAYAKKRQSDLAHRETKQKAYIAEFLAEVVSFLDFHPRYRKEANLLAEKVTAHATPVGSGTVARTKLIPVARRAEAAVIAWLRHATTSYDSMRIARVKGRRREIRRQLATKSVEALQAYRQGRELGEDCPLQKALA